MDASILAALVGVAGILLGGGLQTIREWLARKSEAKSVLSALVAEIGALTRLINHRGYLPQLVAEAEVCRELINNDRPEEMVFGPQMSMTHDYFTMFGALSAKIGLLQSDHADHIVRFYTLAKAATEGLISTEAALKPMSASQRLEALESDIALWREVVGLGQEVIRLRRASKLPATTGFVDPHQSGDKSAA